MKTCTRCGKSKTFNEFYPCGIKKIDSICKPCRINRQRESRTKKRLSGPKVCPGCGLEKPPEAFVAETCLYPRCNDCRKDYKRLARARRYWTVPGYRDKAIAKNREWRAKNPESRRWNYMSRYGITPEQFEAKLASQGGRCALCRTDKPGGTWGQWQQDHDHKTKRLRGLLCWRCNISIGRFADDPTLLKAAIRYLHKWEQAAAPILEQESLFYRRF